MSALESLSENNVCIARVATSFNQVGLSLWTAGFCLIEACVGGLLPLGGKIVCEVGAGVGLTAVALSKVAAISPHNVPSRLIMTDYCPQVLENMDCTLAANGIDFASMWQRHPPQLPPQHAFIVSDLLDVRDARSCADFALLYKVSKSPAARALHHRSCPSAWCYLSATAAAPAPALLTLPLFPSA